MFVVMKFALDLVTSMRYAYMMSIILLAFCTLLNQTLTISESASHFYLTNKNMKVHISKSLGEVSSIEIKGKQAVLNPLRIETYLADGQTQESVQRTIMESRTTTGICVRSTKEYAHFHQTTRFMIDDQGLLIEVTLKGNTSYNLEARVDYRQPLSGHIDKVFFPDGKETRPNKRTLKEFLVYRKDFAVPFAAFYSNASDVGFSIYAPFEIRKPMLKFFLDNGSVIISYQNLRLSGTQSVRTAIGIIPHGNDWRPGLKVLLERYPDYFNPAVNITNDGEGWYYLADAFDNEQKIKELQQRNVTWTELHGHFPFYGLYLPDRNEWGIIFDSGDHSFDDWIRGSGRYKNSYARMSATIEMWHKYNIQVYLYFQCFEAWYQYAQKYFETSIARDEYGNPLPAWDFTHLMNPDPAGLWGKHIEQQINELLRRYPAVDGIFYDRMDYWHDDYGHDDGSTMVDNKTAYTLAFAQQRINDVIFNTLHKANKGVWGNGPAGIELCKNLDGIMAERYPSNLFRLQYLAVTRPIIYLAYDRQPEETEAKLKNALLCGAFPSVTYGDIQCKQLDERYKPLFDLLKNRTWVLEAHAVEAPSTMLSNIFQTPHRDYVVVLVNPKKNLPAEGRVVSTIRVKVRVQDTKKIMHVYLISADWTGTRELDFRKNTEGITVEVPEPSTALALLFTEKKRL